MLNNQRIPYNTKIYIRKQLHLNDGFNVQFIIR